MKRLTCRSCAHSADTGTELRCDLSDKPAAETCERFEYEPGTDEEAGNKLRDSVSREWLRKREELAGQA